MTFDSDPNAPVTALIRRDENGPGRLPRPLPQPPRTLSLKEESEQLLKEVQRFWPSAKLVNQRLH